MGKKLQIANETNITIGVIAHKKGFKAKMLLKLHPKEIMEFPTNEMDAIIITKEKGKVGRPPIEYKIV